MNSDFGIKKLLGFGFMRLPMIGDEVDIAQTCEMVDYYLENGFNYFDTAHGYIDGKSEKAIKTCLTSRYPRDSYILTTKLSVNFFNSEEDIRPLFENQLETCGVEYFDFYLMHAQCSSYFEKYKRCRAYETAFALKAEGKIKHVGISFHDRAAVLDQILTEYPEIEVVQLQFNYLDYDDITVESKLCYEVCRKHDKPVIVMEPVKGGKLAAITDKGREVFDSLGGEKMSSASYAIRFAAGFEGVVSVLSGMGNMDMIRDNVSYMKDFVPLSEKELDAVFAVRDIIRSAKFIDCTGCRYCVERCPKKIPIPQIFTCMNNSKMFKDWMPGYYYELHTSNGAKASDCISCGKCEEACPQHLPVPQLLLDAVELFEKEN